MDGRLHHPAEDRAAAGDMNPVADRCRRGVPAVGARVVDGVAGLVEAAFAIAPTTCMQLPQAVAQAISLRGIGISARGFQGPAKPAGAGLSVTRCVSCCGVRWCGVPPWKTLAKGCGEGAAGRSASP
jgi:hypothetical protein